MHDSTTLEQKLDEHTQTMIHSHDGTLDSYACEARAWMYAGMQELVEISAFDAVFLRWLEAQQATLIEQANQARRERFLL